MSSGSFQLQESSCSLGTECDWKMLGAEIYCLGFRVCFLVSCKTTAEKSSNTSVKRGLLCIPPVSLPISKGKASVCSFEVDLTLLIKMFSRGLPHGLATLGG